MKESRLIKVWNIIYPIGIYFVVANVSMFLLEFVIPDAENQYMLLQTISTVICIPFLYSYYRQDNWFLKNSGKMVKLQWNRARLIDGILILVLFASASVALNNWIAITGLKEQSTTYQEISDAFFSSGIFMEILGTCIAAPVLEELLYRGLVYRRLKQDIGMRGAVLLSALIFGMMHMNLVQFIYAFLLGILLAWSMEREGHVYAAVLGHMAANMIAVLRSETHFLSWMEPGTSVFGAGTIAATMMAFLCMYVLFGKRVHKKLDEE